MADPEKQPGLSASAQRVQNALNSRGFTLHVVELPASTRSASEAAEAISCQVGQIAKSLIFKGHHSDRPVLVIASGSNRVNEDKVAEILGEPLGKADAAFVKEQTGYSIGGVPPIGHITTVVSFIDRDLLAYSEIWAAAGTPHAVFNLSPTDLVDLTGGSVISII